MMYHGNGGNMGHRIPLARVFYVKLRCNVLMVSYRGCAWFTLYHSYLTCDLRSYGLSQGSPSEKGKEPVFPEFFIF
jgi:hypothetical protein